VIPLAGMAGGILASRLLPFDAVDAWVGLVAVAGLAGIAVWRGFRVATWLAIFCLCLCGGVLIELARRPGPPPRIDFEPREAMLLSGCVVEPPVLSLGREQFVMELDHDARARVTLYNPADLAYGEMVEVEARLRRPRNYGNPGAFDFENYLARQHVYWTASASTSATVKRFGTTCGSGVLRWLYGVRSAALGRLDRIFTGNDYAIGMSRAVLVGDGSRLEKIWTESYQRTGTYHALVISGLHLTTMAACILFLVRVFEFSATVSFLITAILGWMYALMAGGNPPVTRAAAGLTLYLIAKWFFRRPRVLNLLSLVAMLFLAYDPRMLTDPSFQLSFLAVSVIGAVGSPFLDAKVAPYAHAAAVLPYKGRDYMLMPHAASWAVEMRLLAETFGFITKLPVKLWTRCISIAARGALFALEMFIISAVVQLAMVLPMAFYFHRVSLTGLSANMLVVPLMNILVPVGFVAILTQWPTAAWVSTVLLDWSRAIVEWHAVREGIWRIPEPPAWLAICFVAALLLAAVVLRYSGVGWRFVMASMLFGASLGAVLIHPFAPRLYSGQMEVTLVDVGQGDSILAASPEGKLMLIDGGGFPNFGRKVPSNLDIGEDVVSPYLWTRSIRLIDVIAVTHGHEDHVGGVAALLANFRPRELWYGAIPDSDSWRELRALATRLGVRVVRRSAGEALNWGGVRVDILSPSAEYEPGEKVSNNDSLVLRLSYGLNAFLLTGDVERRMEQRLLDDGLVRPADFLKISHHGSKTSTSQEFLDAVAPRYAAVSAGVDNPYRHPSPEVVERVAGVPGLRLLRTDQDGLIQILSDGTRLSVNSHLR